jgi:(2Fe-2S) ferredoxin
MAQQNLSPYVCHLFVCVNDRGGERKSCADGNSPAIKKLLKEKVAQRGWRPHVRVSHCGCMGLCADGPNIVLYPQKIWFSDVCDDDIEEILAAVQKILKQAGVSI